MANTIEQARARYNAAIKGPADEAGSAEFVAAKVALIELNTGRKLTEDEIAYI